MSPVLVRILFAMVTARAITRYLNSDFYPRVTIEQGVLSGIVLKSFKGKSFYSFQGIPYAAPPIGNLRFKAPQAPPQWKGERLAWREGNDCVQIHFIFHQYTGTEDCLYLNVYTPRLRRKGVGLDVLVWIHGGGFFSGSGSTEIYGPEYLIDHDVVLVTFNYRLGPFGFLNLGTSEAPGNYGLKDQVAALRWIQKNIAKFGGNPKAVTVFGQSAGGASIHYLMLSPQGQDLFHRAVIQSGTAHSNWAFQRDAVNETLKVAARLGCNQTADQLACLRKINSRDLAMLDYKLRNEKMQLTYFAPSVEPPGTKDAILSDDPRKLLSQGKIHCIPMIAGFTSAEGLMTVGMMKEKQLPIQMELFGNPRHFVPPELELEENSNEFLDVWNNISDYYERLEPTDLTQRFVLLATDADFARGVDELVRAMSATCQTSIFYYTFSYDGNLSFLKKVYRIEDRKGTSHFDDIGYLFARAPIADMFRTPSESDFTTVHRMTLLWTNFAKTGNPTPDSSLGVTWNPVTLQRIPDLVETRHLDFGEKLISSNTSLLAERFNFWKHLIQEHRLKQNKII